MTVVDASYIDLFEAHVDRAMVVGQTSRRVGATESEPRVAVVHRLTAALALLLSLPLLLAVVLAIKATSPGPAVYRQVRVGHRGRHFTLLKFRTMVVDADRYRNALGHLNEADGLLFKIRNDPRVTHVGAWLRRYSLDELPQLWNVLRGDMALVGPRPALPEEVACYDAVTRRRLEVMPGLTGLWQISGRSDLDWDDSVRLDLAYVERRSGLLDLQVILRTFAAVVRGAGAY